MPIDSACPPPAKAGQASIAVDSFHSASRMGQDGRLVLELFVNFVQTLRSTLGPSEEYGGIPVRAGCTVIASATGRIRYVIAKSFDAQGAAESAGPGGARGARQRAFVEELDARDPMTPYWIDDEARQNRMKARASFRALHGRVSR